MKKKLNKFDIIVIAAVVLVIIGAVLKFTVLGHTGETETVNVSYVVKVCDVREYTIDAIDEGDTLFAGSDDAEIGTIAVLDVETSKTLIGDPDGTIVWGERQDRYDFYLTVDVEAEQVDGVYRVGTNELRINQEITLFTKYSAFTGIITEITTAN